MIQRIMLSLMLLLVGTSLSAQHTAREWIAELNKSLGARYGIHIEVNTEGVDRLAGYYMVDGDAYYLTLGVMEVYSDAKLRYEINNERKEVTEDMVNLDSVDLLSNPTRAFQFVEDEFTATIVEQSSEGAVLRLVPHDDTLGITYISLMLRRDAGGVIPVSISYDYDGYVVAIELQRADIESSELPRWREHKDDYRAYDMVSFL